MPPSDFVSLVKSEETRKLVDLVVDRDTLQRFVTRERQGRSHHKTIHRLTARFAPLLLERFHRSKRSVTGKWHVDEISTKVRGQRMYLYRAIDNVGDTGEFYFGEQRWSVVADRTASTSTVARPIGRRSFPATPQSLAGSLPAPAEADPDRPEPVFDGCMDKGRSAPMSWGCSVLGGALERTKRTKQPPVIRSLSLPILVQIEIFEIPRRVIIGRVCLKACFAGIGPNAYFAIGIIALGIGQI